MVVSKEYFHDRMVLVLLTVSVFLAVLGSLLIVLRLDPGRNEGIIVQYRAVSAVNSYKYGSSSDLLAFIGFLVIVLVFDLILSLRVYSIHRQFAVTVLGLGVLLMVLAIIVSNALLVFR